MQWIVDSIRNQRQLERDRARQDWMDDYKRGAWLKDQRDMTRAIIVLELDIKKNQILKMKVLTAELVQSNKREHVSGGVYIEFDTTESVKKEDYFQIKVDNKTYDFQVAGIKVVGDELKVSAREVGYWATKLDHKGIDLRTVIGADVVAVTDEEEKKEIHTRSCWC